MKCYSDLLKKKKIKTENNKMEINTYLSTIESKKKNLSKQELRQNHGYKECFDGCQMRGRCGGMCEEVRGLRSPNR